MKKSKILIQLFPMVDDIDQLEKTLFQLRQNSVYIDRSKFYVILDVTYPLSDYFVDWDNSILKKDFFLSKFEILKKYGDWCDESYFNIDGEVKGCTDMCINNIYKYDVDDILMLDNDVVFNPYTLSTILEASLETKKQTPNYIITPEHVKMWDESWDIVTNNHFKTKSNVPFYVLINDPIDDSFGNYGDFEIEPLIQNNQRIFKFGGGWFTLFSKHLLDLIEFPRDIKGYGAIDTFIMTYCKYIPNAVQYKVKNLVICEDRKYLGKSTYSSYIKNIDRRYEYKEESWNKMMNHLKLKLSNDLSKSKPN
jgi:hypothetical protein